MSSTTNGKALYENLDTTFVSLWSLLRNLTQRGFVGRVHVELANYSADVFLNGSGNPWFVKWIAQQELTHWKKQRYTVWSCESAKPRERSACLRARARPQPPQLVTVGVR